MNEKSFKQFLKEEEDKHPYLTSLEDELGINPEDLEREPQIASFFSLGKVTKNIGPYRVIKFKRNEEGNITHALVKQIDDFSIKNRKYKDKEGNITRIEKRKNEDSKTFLVPIEELDRLLSQDFQPQADTSGAADLGQMGSMI